jgi:hypothetical protein
MASKNSVELFLVSFIMLFLEVALIRWISTDARIFAYVNNLVLLSCFLGIGLGCYNSKKEARLSWTALGMSVLLIVVNLPFIFQVEGRYIHFFKDAPLLLSSFADSVVWFPPEVKSVFYALLLGLLSTLTIFLVILLIFVPLGQILGRSLEESDNAIKAYSLNVAASLLGVWCFSLFSLAYSPPFIWFSMIAAAILILFLVNTHHGSDVILSSVVFILLIISTMVIPSKLTSISLTVWSPYQKLQIQPSTDPSTKAERGYRITVNNVGYMGLIDNSDDFIGRNSDVLSIQDRKFAQYDIPYMFKPDAETVLILGAGGGNDAAGALRNNVTSIDAVEIDPGIYLLGLKNHPEQPYSDPRVNVVIDDARSYFKKCQKKYDVISFGLLDSHTLSSNYNNMRIDHYVYTLESIQEARNLLKEDGILTVVFEGTRQWIDMRIYELLERAFGFPPLAFDIRGDGRYGWGGSTMWVTALNRDALEESLIKKPSLKEFYSKHKIDFEKLKQGIGTVRATTDDWPYLYLEKPAIPKIHLCIMLVLGLLFAFGKKMLFSKEQRLDYHFFFLGAAFLLLEFQNISKSTLLFGSTWMVNSFIISTILVLILLANLVAAHFKMHNVKVFYILLIASILIVFIFPLSLFNNLSFWPRSIVSSMVLNLPIFFAGIIFINSFQKTERKDLAFGSNLLGAAFGGILESISFVIGINMVLLVVAGFYSLSYVFIKRRF